MLKYCLALTFWALTLQKEVGRGERKGEKEDEVDGTWNEAGSRCDRRILVDFWGVGCLRFL